MILGMFFIVSNALAGHAATPTADRRSRQFISSPIYATSLIEMPSFLQISNAEDSFPPSRLPWYK